MLTLLFHAQIRTMNPALPRADAAVVENGRFAFVGAESAARLWLAGRAFTEVDADGATVTPGLNDAHLHLSHCAMRGRNVLLSGAASREETVARLRAGLENHSGGWLVGEGWNQEAFWDRRLLTREDLDAVSGEVPVIASRVCGHILAANSRAMEIAGVSKPDGIFREDEQGALHRCMPAAKSEDILNSMLVLQEKLFAQGITSVQSDDLGPVPDGETARFLRALRDACACGRMKLRYAEQALRESLEELRAFLQEDLHRLFAPTFRVSCLKVLADGSLGARTAYLSGDYADAPGEKGVAIYTDEALCALVREAASHGLPTAIHAIGDAAMEQALRAFAQEGKNLRNAVVHAQLTTAAQAARCGRLGVHVLAQPIFLDADAPIVRARVGGALAGTSYCWRSMLSTGANVAFSTDSPVEPFDTMPNLYCAVTRRGRKGAEPYLPDEAFTLDEALFAYTAAGARVTKEEAEKGRIQPGHYADFVVWDRRMDEREPESLLETRARETYVGGERVYAR